MRLAGRGWFGLAVGLAACVAPLAADEPARPDVGPEAEARAFVAAMRAAVEGRDGAAFFALLAPRPRAELTEALRQAQEQMRGDAEAVAQFKRELKLDADPLSLPPEELARRALGAQLAQEVGRDKAMGPLGVEVLGARRDGERLLVRLRSRPQDWFRGRDGTHELALERDGGRWTFDPQRNARHVSKLVEILPLVTGGGLSGILPDGGTLVLGPAREGAGTLALAPFRREGGVRRWDFAPAQVRLVAVAPTGRLLLVALEDAQDEELDMDDYIEAVSLVDGGSQYIQEGQAVAMSFAPDGLAALFVAPGSREVRLSRTLWTPGYRSLWRSEWRDVAAVAWLAGGKEVVAREEGGDLVFLAADGGTERLRIPHRGGASDVLAAHPTEPWVAVPHAEGGIVLYDARDGKELRRVGDLQGIEQVSFSPDGRQLLLVRGARAVRHDARDGARLGEHRAEAAFRGIHWHPTLPLLLAASREADGRDGVWVFSTAD